MRDTTYGRAAEFERERGRRAFESALDDARGERETESVPIDVHGDSSGIFATVPHLPDLPQPFNEDLQAWAREHFDLSNGETIEEAGVMEYVPNGRILSMEVRQ